ncbi:MAG: hypothetical protein JW786_00440 [Desulfobacterales bacterium]|nr:hypothetical protein [Desulfobacterales bacterium]
MTLLLDQYVKLLSEKDFSILSSDAAIERIGILSDLAFQLKKKEGLIHAVSLSKKIKHQELSFSQLAILNYHISNIYGYLHKLTITCQADLWKWEQEDIEKQLLYLRHAVNALQKENVKGHLREKACPIYTNLAGTLSHIGRFVEAIEYWNKALDISPSFSMARGNRGYGLIHYAHALYDDLHSMIFLQHAYQDLKKALQNEVDEPAAKFFQSHFDDLKKAPGITKKKRRIDLTAYPPGKTKNEIAYKKWCLKNRLFLNPLNDLDPYPAAAADILSTPSIVMQKGENPYYHGYFNQMKQEFVSARWLYYEGISTSRKHFSDQNVLLFDTLDHPVYGLSIEKIKISFRMAYSLFDKIAFFLNRYLNLSIGDKKVNFRTFWYSSHPSRKILRDILANSQNWSLRGLFWLAKDLYEDKKGFKAALEPDAGRIHAIRNQLEHQYLKLHGSQWQGPCANANPNEADAPFGFSMYLEDFIAKTLRILKMVRAALIYLCLAIHREETKRSAIRKADKNIPVIELPIINDELIK